MVKKHLRDKRTSKGERRSSKSVPLDDGFLIRMNKGTYAKIKTVAKTPGRR